MKSIRIFAASPSDMKLERSRIQTAADVLRPLADALNIKIEVLDWRNAVPNMGRPEQVILDELKPSSWDVFIGILWHRFGTPPGNADPESKRDYLSGTEEEFQTAYRLWKRFGKPRLMMYRCTRHIPPDVLDPDQYKLVKSFFESFDAVKGENPGLFQSFDTTAAFEKLLVDNIQRLLLSYFQDIRGEPAPPEVIQVYAPKVPDNLPRRAAFFGRDDEVARALRALSPTDRTWGLLVDGIGGIGKTAFALETAYIAKEQGLFDAFIFVSAKTSRLTATGIREETPAARTLVGFLNETARVLGQNSIARLPDSEKRQALFESFRSQKTLLVYDNLETLSKEEQEALSEFLRELPPQSKAIVTSRRRGGEGAVWLRLDKLEWPASLAIIENQIAHDERLTAKMKAVPKDRWHELHEATYGSPLALMHIVGLMSVRASLTFDAAVALLGGAENDLPLQEFIYQEAQKELTPDDKLALSALSMFDPSAQFDEWLAIAHLTRNALETVIDRLGALSLVNIAHGEERFLLHPLTRSFIHGNFLIGDDAVRMTLDFADYWYRNHVRKFLGPAGKKLNSDRIDAVWGNVNSALERLGSIAIDRFGRIHSEDAGAMFLRMIRSLRLFLSLSGRTDEVAKYLAVAYEIACALEMKGLAGWHAYHLSQSHCFLGEIKEAKVWLKICEESWRLEIESSPSIGKKTALLQLKGLILQKSRKYSEAKEVLQAAYRITQDRDGHYAEKATAANRLGELAHAMRKYETARKYYREAYMLAQKKKDYKRILSYVLNLGKLAYDEEKLISASHWFRKALLLARRYSIIESIATIQDRLAHIYSKSGKIEQAVQAAQEAFTILKRLHRPEAVATERLLLELTEVSTPS